MNTYYNCQKVAFKTIYSREVTRFMRIWIQTLLPTPITMTLYFLVFGKIIGGKIGLIHGVSYLQYITPGLIMLGVINNTYSNVVSSFFSSKFQRSIEEILIAPVSPFTMMMGFVLGGMTRGFFTAVLTLLLAEVLTDFTMISPYQTILMLVITSYFFAQAGLTNGIFARKFDDVSIVPTFVLTPMIYLGGVFYSTSLLSPFWQNISHLNPLFYVINGFRYAMLGHSDVHLSSAVFILLIMSLTITGINYHLLKARKNF